MSDEKQLCEACLGPANGDQALMTPASGYEDVGGAIVCADCVANARSRSGGELLALADSWRDLCEKVRSRRSTPAAKVELEPLDFECQVAVTIRRRLDPAERDDSAPGVHLSIYLNPGDRVSLNGNYLQYPSDRVDLDRNGCSISVREVPRIHAELLALRDSTAPPAQTEPEALRGLAEAMRNLCECFCADCRTICPPQRMVPMDELCVYCHQNNMVHTGDGDMGRICEWPKGYGIERAAPPPAPERHASDWYVDPDAPAGLA